MLAENMTVENSMFSNTAGTPPAAGVDLEPDHPTYRFINISFVNCSFVNNQGGGIDMTTVRAIVGSSYSHLHGVDDIYLYV
jgi:hypothetical protein